MATTESLAMGQEFYVAYYGRPADPSGLTYWADRFDASDDLTEVLAAFGESVEFTANFGSLTDSELVNNLYLQMFNRPAEAEGLAFYTDLLTSGDATLASIAKQIVDGASGDDVTVLANKVTVAQTYTAAVTSMSSTYESDDIADAQAILDAVDATADSVTAGNAAAEAEVASNVESTTFTLTCDPDIASANIFTAGRVWNPGGTDFMNSLNDDDILTGTGTNPTLNMTFVNDTESLDLNIMPEMSNIETVNVKFTADFAQTLDLQDTTGLLHLNATRIDNIAANITFDNIQSALTTASVANSNDNTLASMIFDHSASALSGTSDEVALTVGNVQMNNLRIDGVSQGYETINLTSTDEANTLNTLTIEDTETLNIDGTADLRLGAVANTVTAAGATLVEANTMAAGLVNATGSITVVDASDFEGNLTYHIGGEINANADSTGLAVALSVTGGSGDDRFVLVNGNNIDAAAANTDTIDGGDGDNVLVITGGAAQVVAAPAAGANLLNIQSLEIRAGQDGAAFADVVTVDADAFDSLASITVRNEGQAANVAAAENMTVTLNDLTVAQAAAITVLHGTTGNNGLVQNILVSDVKTNTAADVLGVTLEDAVNINPRFNLQLTDSGLTSYESVTITDNDAESNTVQLNSFANYTGTLTVTGGEAADFMNFDSTANAYSKVTTGATGDGTTVDAALLAVFGQDTTGTISVRDTAIGYSLDTKAGGELLVADVAAGTYAGDIIVRNGVADQTITTGTGNDTIIFADRAGITASTAGLSISDTVVGGTGTDMIVLDGTGAVVLGASEWTKLSGIDAVQIAGFAGSTATLLITDQLVDQSDGGSNLGVYNNDGDLNTTVEIAATIDLRQMSATNGITFIGANAAGQAALASTVQTIIVDDVTANGASTLNGGDRDILTNYSATGFDNLGVAYLTQAAADADWLANLGVGLDGNNNVLAYHATTSTNEITIGDLANVTNFSTLTFDNDTALVQTYTVTLNDAVVGGLVDASHTANATAFETLTMTANGSATVPLATGAFSLNAATVTAPYHLVVNGGNGNDIIVTGAGIDTITGGVGADTLTGGAGVDTFIYAIATDGADTYNGFNWGGTAANDDLQLTIGVTDDIAGGAGNVSNAINAGAATVNALAVDAGAAAGTDVAVLAAGADDTNVALITDTAGVTVIETAIAAELADGVADFLANTTAANQGCLVIIANDTLGSVAGADSYFLAHVIDLLNDQTTNVTDVTLMGVFTDLDAATAATGDFV